MIKSSTKIKTSASKEKIAYNAGYAQCLLDVHEHGRSFAMRVMERMVNSVPCEMDS